MSTILRAVTISLALCCSTAAVAGDATKTTPTEFNITASALADALSKFGAQSGLQVLYPLELVRGMKAPALTGKYSVDAALQKLLKGTGLQWSYASANTIVLKKPENSAG